MDDLIRPDEELEAREFEEATSSKWKRPNMPAIRKPKFKFSEREWLLNKWVIGIAIFLVLLFGGRWIAHELRTNSDTITPVATVDTNPATSAQPTAGANAQASTPEPVVVISQTTSQIPNTGPGSTLAIFLVATIVAGGVHYVIVTRKS